MSFFNIKIIIIPPSLERRVSASEDLSPVPEPRAERLEHPPEFLYLNFYIWSNFSHLVGVGLTEKDRYAS